jgi:hypothetical protein
MGRLGRLRAGEWLAAAGSVALLVALFLPWYEFRGLRASGFEALTVIDVLLALLALLAISLPVLQAAQDGPAKPVAVAVLTATLGKIGVLLVLFRMIDEPGADYAELDVGVYLALVATVAITAGGWLSLMNEHVRGLPPDVEPDLRPTPAP